jgi:hypothetical protein
LAEARDAHHPGFAEAAAAYRLGFAEAGVATTRVILLTVEVSKRGPRNSRWRQSQIDGAV